MKRYTADLLSETTGLSLSGATLQLLVPGTTTRVVLFAEDDMLGATVSQPVPNGTAFYVPDGRYDLLATGPRGSKRVLDVDFFDGFEQNRRLEAVENGEPGALGSLRADLLSDTGAEHIKDKLPDAGAIPRDQASQNGETLSVNKFGALGDATTDDTAAINRAVLAAALRGGGEVIFGSSALPYRVKGPVILPSAVVLNLNGQTLTGDGFSDGNTMFITGTVENGTLVSNLGSTEESKIVGYTRIRNGIVKNISLAFHMRNFNFGCSIDDVCSFAALQYGKFERCFYMSMNNCHARGPSDALLPSYHFLEANNLIHLRRISATSASAFWFEGGSTSVTMTSCSGEGGVGTALKFKGDCLGFTIEAGYWEAIQGTLFDFTEAGACSINFKSNYINLVDTIFDYGGASASATLFGSFDASNYIANVGVTGSGFLYRGLMKVAGPRNSMQFEVPYANDTVDAVPANWTIDKGTRIKRVSGRTGNSLTDIRSRSVLYGTSVAPLVRSGDTGTPIPNEVTGATHQAFAPGDASVTILVTSKLVWQPDSGRATFQFRVVDQSGGRTTKLAGEVYGDLVKRSDSNTGFNIIAVNANGFLRLELYGFTSPAGVYSCTGDIHLP